MQPIETIGIVYFNSKDAVLLVEHGPASKHPPDTYGLPAGRIDPGETAIQAAMRELKEETGYFTLESALHELPETYTADLPRKSGETVLMHMRVFYCTEISGTGKATEEASPIWVLYDRAFELDLMKNVPEAIRQAYAFKNNFHR